MQLVSLAVLHGDPPQVIIADDLPTLHWRIALEIVARTDPSELSPGDAAAIRQDLLDEQWGAAVERWLLANNEALDVYESWELHTAGDVEIAPAELQFTPLFRAPPEP